MYLWHAWIVLSESTIESNEGSLITKVNQLRDLVQEKQLYAVPNDPICTVNVDHVFQCSGSHNHRGDAHDRLVSVIAWIADRLPGSYGLIYWCDDEIPGTRVFDGYNVIVLARGKIANRYDPFLSPITPNVED